MNDLLILVVDDDLQIRLLLSDFLETEEYRVATAPNGAAALDLVEQECPDLILLDMNMPILDGWEFVRRMGQRGLDLPIVVMTAARDAQHVAAEVGAAGWLHKPFDLDTLIGYIGVLTARVAQPPDSPGAARAAGNDRSDAAGRNHLAGRGGAGPWQAGLRSDTQPCEFE
ncbi:MAG TPA: response regulator [Dehalococcoidia bacterium]|nr:response regulator [Dehalococcoidia bacterium]